MASPHREISSFFSFLFDLRASREGKLGEPLRKLQRWEGLRSSRMGLRASWEGLRPSWVGLRASWEGLGSSLEGL